jgi:hypothetical protein
MNNKRMIGLVGGALVIVAAILIGLGFKLAPPAESAGTANSGIGELQRYEGKLAGGSEAVFTGFGDLQRYEQKLASANSSTFTGFGDLQSYEQKLALSAITIPSASLSSVPVRDLRHPEWKLALAYPSIQANSPLYTGFGDAQRYEQALALRSDPAYTGFGDLQRYETQLMLLAGANQIRSVGMGDLQQFEARP